MSHSSSRHINSTRTIKEFKIVLHECFKNVNLQNSAFIEDLFLYMSKLQIKGHVHFIDTCSAYFKTRRNGKGVSKISKDYWLSMGWSLDEAIRFVSDLQKKRSHFNIDYWLNKGLTLERAKLEVNRVQSYNSNKRYEKYTKAEISEQSVWSKKHWLNKGLSEKEADYEVSKRNYSKREFWSSDSEYEEIKKIIGKKTSDFIKENPELYSSFFGSVSKEEIEFFKYTKLKIPGILHKQFIVNVKKSKELNPGIVKYDGYIKTSLGIILIEYDGLYWHNQTYDEIKDSVTLGIRDDILGILRISCKQYKTNKKNIIKLINHGIEKIKSKESNRIKIY